MYQSEVEAAARVGQKGAHVPARPELHSARQQRYLYESLESVWIVSCIEVVAPISPIDLIAPISDDDGTFSLFPPECPIPEATSMAEVSLSLPPLLAQQIVYPGYRRT